MRMLRLHQGGELVLINPAQIQTVQRADDELDTTLGTVIRFSGSDWLYVDENLETIDRLVALS